MAETVLPPAMRNALRLGLVPLQAALAFRNGPANAQRMNLGMGSLKIRSWSVIRFPFSRTATFAGDPGSRIGD
jgi:hypothetical protein